MAEYGYIRISSKDQNPNRQFDAMVNRGITDKMVFVDRMSGKDFKRPAYQKLIKRLRKDDLIVIKSIDRLGRNYDEILEQWRIITREIEANIEVLDIPLLNTASESNGLTGKLISDLVLQILAYVAETERAFIRQRQKEGIAAAMTRGVVFGRPKVNNSEYFNDAYKLWMAGTLTTREAAEYAGMSHTTFFRRLKDMKL